MAIGKNNNQTAKNSGFFEGYRFAVELGVVSQSKKKEIIQPIEENGGVVDYVISKKTTHIVTNEGSLSSYKLKSARVHGCFFVSEDYISDCVTAGKHLDESRYLLVTGDASPRSEGGYDEDESPRAFARSSVVANPMSSPARVNEALSRASLNIAALCAGLGARVPEGKFPLKSIVNNLYNTVLLNKKDVPKVANAQVQSPKKTTIPQPKTTASSKLTVLPPKNTVLSLPKSSLLAQPKPFTFPSVSTSALKSSSSSSSSSSPSSSSTPSPTRTPAQPALSSFSSSRPTFTSFSFSSSRTLPSTSSPASSSPSSSFTTLKPAPTASNTVSYSYAQFEAERKKQREEEKAKRAEESGSVLREREIRRKEEEEVRKQAVEDKRLELLERRRVEDEERKQKNKELTEAREKRIAEERKKREQIIEKLKQKPTIELLTTSLFKQWDDEENDKKMKEEWAQYAKQMEEDKKKMEAKERAAQERADRLFAEKERKIQEREEKERMAAADRAAQKIQRREEYERNKELEAVRKKQEFEERQAKLLAEFVKRQEKRARKKLLGEHPELQKNYDEHKIFIGGIKLDDIKSAKLPQNVKNTIRDERINSILRMFDQCGSIHKRQVFAEKGHCFITFEKKQSVETAVEFMKDADTRKKLVEAAKANHEARKMNPLCTPHAQFYVRIPKEKKGKKTQKTEEEDASDASSVVSEGSFTEVVSKKPQQPTAQQESPKPTAVAPQRLARGPRAARSPTASESGSDAGDAPTQTARPIRLYRPPVPKKAPKQVLLPLYSIPLSLLQGDNPHMDPIPTTTNVFDALEDEGEDSEVASESEESGSEEYEEEEGSEGSAANEEDGDDENVEERWR